MRQLNDSVCCIQAARRCFSGNRGILRSMGGIQKNWGTPDYIHAMAVIKQQTAKFLVELVMLTCLPITSILGMYFKAFSSFLRGDP